MRFFSWRSAILRSELPSTTKLVLLVLSTYMDDHGSSCFPSMETIALNAGLTKRAVVTQIKIAQTQGFITATKHGFGDRRWARNEYKIAFPAIDRGEPASPPQTNNAVNDVHHLDQNRGEPYSPPHDEVVNDVPDGGEPDDTEVVKDVHSISPMNSPITSPEDSAHEGREVVEPERTPPKNISDRFAMFEGWNPREHFSGMLIAAGLPATYNFAEDLLDFVGYRLGDRNRFNQAQWESKLRMTVLNNARYRSTQPKPIPSDWYPDTEFWQLLRDQNIDTAWVGADLLPEFILFSRESGQVHRSWSTAFLEFVKRKHQAQIS